ncbi:hypothetical protein ACFC34_00310 [Streptomyces sp. NPDC056053]|uniref:hypothetical protein n=1 Tax=Streptomyces sp. NPDC056053 TaxID=3345696 RepID=UPI0035DF099E
MNAYENAVQSLINGGYPDRQAREILSLVCGEAQNEGYRRGEAAARAEVARLKRSAALAEEDYRRIVRGACQVESQLRARIAELEARPSHSSATPAEIDAHMRQLFSEDAYLRYQQAIGEHVLAEAVEDTQVVRASADNDGLYNADWREGWDDAIERIDPDLNDPCPSTLLTLSDSVEDPYDSPLRPGACDACGNVPEKWCPDCAACRQGCHGGHDGNPCAHPRAPWGGAS